MNPKQILLTFLWVAFLLPVLTEAQPVDTEGRLLITAPFTRTPPTIDGVLSPGEWSGAGSAVVDFVQLGVAGNSGPQVSDGPEDISYTFSVLYDSQYVYLGVSVRDDVYISENYGKRLQWDLPVTWENDAVEYFFDGDVSRTLQAIRNTLETETGGQWIYGRGEGDTPDPFVTPELYGNQVRPYGTGPEAVWYAQTTVNTQTADWQQEARFALSIIGSPRAGSEIGFNINVDDVDTYDPTTLTPDVYVELREIQLYWIVFQYNPGDVTNENTHEIEDLWGTLRFLEPTAIEEWPLF